MAFLSFYFETGSHYLLQGGLELEVRLRLALKVRSFCLSLLNQL